MADRPAMRLLFVTSTRIGDAVLSTGLLNHLIERHPGVRVTIVCGAPAAPLFTAVPELERIFVLHKKPLSLHWLAMWAGCWSRYWDLLVDLRNAPLTYFLAAGQRWCMGRPDDSVHRVVGLARVLGLAGEPPAPHIWIGEKHRERASRLLANGPPVLAVAPTANWPAKTWPAERFAELVSRLTQRSGVLPEARVAVFGHGEERGAALPVLKSVPADRRIDLVGRISLLDVYACLERCNLFVGNDSGLMHLAAAAGVPTLGLFGPSREELYGPWGSSCAVARPPVSYEEIFPAGFDHRNTGTLMGGLSVDRVEEAARTLWSKVQKAA
jgi:ADP-heptose:LPS heptosyltransferase